MKALFMSLVILSTSAFAIPTKDAFSECRVRVERFGEIVKENKEVAFVSILAMELIRRSSGESRDEVIKKFLNLIFAQCVTELQNEERI